jgi:hypothetical protein
MLKNPYLDDHDKKDDDDDYKITYDKRTEDL